jgi:hypothetical protein
MRAWRIVAALAVGLTFSAARHVKPPQPPIGIVINGEALPLEPHPLLDKGVLLVPVQRTIHALGLDFERDGSRMITHIGSKTVVLRDRSRVALVDGDRILLDAPVVLRNDVFYAPLRFFTEVLGAQAVFSPKGRIVTIVAQLIGRSGEGDFVEGNRTVRVGTVTAVDVTSDPPTVTLSFNGVVRTIAISPNAIITMRDVAVNVDSPGELTDIHPGDYAQIVVRKDGTVDSVVDAFGSRYGTIAATSDSEFVLQDGHVIAPDRDTEITLNGGPAALGDLEIGDLVSVRYNVETGEVLEVDAERAQAQTSARNGSASITSVAIDATQPLRAGQVLTVTLDGSPGGAATFDVGPYVQNVAMSENAPGTYVGTYVIPRSANFTGIPIVGHLRMPDGSSVDAQSAQTLSAAGTPPGIASFGPPEDATVNAQEPAIYATFATQAVAVDPSSIRIRVDGTDVTDDALRTPNFVQYLPGMTYRGKVRVMVRVADFAGNVTTKSWIFFVRHGV